MNRNIFIVIVIIMYFETTLTMQHQEEIKIKLLSSDNCKLDLSKKLAETSELLNNVCTYCCDSTQQPIPIPYCSYVIEKFINVWQHIITQPDRLTPLLEQLSAAQRIAFFNIADYFAISPLIQKSLPIIVKKICSQQELQMLLTNKKYYKKTFETVGFCDKQAAKCVTQKLLQLRKPQHCTIIYDSRNQINQKEIEQNEIGCLEFTPDDRFLATGSNNVINLYDYQQANNGKLYISLASYYRAIKALTFQPQGPTLATAHRDDALSAGEGRSYIKLWDYQHDTKSYATIPHDVYDNCIVTLSYNSAGILLASGATHDRRVKLWDMRKYNEPLTTLENKYFGVQKVIFSHDGTSLAAAGNEIKIWNTNNFQNTPITLSKDGYGSITSLAFSQDDTFLASGFEERLLLIWDHKNKQEFFSSYVARDKQHPCWTRSRPTELQYSPLGMILAVGQKSGKLSFWDYANKEQINIIPAHKQEITSLAFTHDGIVLASSSSDEISVRTMINKKEFEQATLRKAAVLLAKEKLSSNI